MNNPLANFFKTKEPDNYYKILGEETGVYELVKTFYEVMESDPKAIDCLNTHELTDGKIDDEVKKKLFMFLCGWLGGPNLFVENYGAPRMRARHIHVKITENEKEQWLYCMDNALKLHPIKLKKKHYQSLLNSFTALGIRIRNA